MDMMPIANKLELEGLGVQASTLFINLMPMECKEGILLRSPLSGTRVDHELPGYYRTSFMVIVRGHDYASASVLMEACMRALTLYETDLDDISVKYMRPHTLPVTFPVSIGNFYEIKVEFEVAYNGASFSNGY
jgi:hypothetical protein